MTSNGGNTKTSSSSSSFNLRPKQVFNPRAPLTDREEMDSPIVPKTTNTSDSNKKSTSEILANHPLTKNMNNLSSLIKTKDSHHHHHHHSSTNKNLTPTASSITRDELFTKYQSFLQMSSDEFDVILQQLRDLKLSKSQSIEFLQYIFDQSLREQNQNIRQLVRLCIYLQKNSFINNHQCLQVLTNILSKIQDYEKDIALFKSELATLIANFIWSCLTNEQDGGKSNNTNQQMFLLILY